MSNLKSIRFECFVRIAVPILDREVCPDYQDLIKVFESYDFDDFPSGKH